MGVQASTAFASCHKIMNNDVHNYETAAEFHAAHGEDLHNPMRSAAACPVPPEDSPKLGVRIFANPCVDSDGGALCARFLTAGSEILVGELQQIKGWDCLRARFERSAKERAGIQHTQAPLQSHSAQPRMQWPEGYRFNTTRRFWRAKVRCQDGRGGFEEHLCMLIVADRPEDRTHANVEKDLKDSADVASYATRFNQQLRKIFGENGGNVPGVRVCGAVGCEIIKSSSMQFASPGEALTIIPYPFPDVKKFLLDGSEDFLEVPQAFFHHAAWLSGSHEIVCDLQGIEDDDSNIILVDPVVIRAPKATVGNLLTAMATTVVQNHADKENHPEAQVAGDVSAARFDALHPRCSQLCKVFDPHRRSACKRACGLNISCGV